jgi:hypothetical protein
VAAGLCTPFIVTETVTKSDTDIGMKKDLRGCGFFSFRCAQRLRHGQFFTRLLRLILVRRSPTYNVGLVQDKMGKHDEATASFKKAVDLAPNDPGISTRQR